AVRDRRRRAGAWPCAREDVRGHQSHGDGARACHTVIVLIVAAAWLTGATLGALGYTTWWPAIALGSVGAGLYLVVAGRRGSAVICVLAVLACLASLARYDAALPEAGPTGIAVYNEGEPVRLLGTIASEP